MVRRSQRATKPVSPSTERLGVSDHQDASTFVARPSQDGIEDPYTLSAPELVKAILDINRDPAVERLALALSHIVSADVSKVADEEKRARSVVLSGIPEADPGSRPSERQVDLENKVMDVLNVLDVECRPVEVYRLGRPDPSRPRLIKVVFPTRAHWRTALSNGRLLRSSRLSGVFIRRSMTEEERKKDYELRQIAREKNAGLSRKEWVVYRGEVRRISELPKASSSGNC
ncbi:hypothetical protein Y032_0216g2378 [Ancylostoma ceylanicum]|uniref:Uncharacterized protein n=1 Tax=Ancylostoma ceylanicum TaxID=53326 RepID=A0A016SJ03_9BILA|nr:hypothetical protein Y032_0216g2378 [Ancylostoma ceylanicum]